MTNLFMSHVASFWLTSADKPILKITLPHLNYWQRLGETTLFGFGSFMQIIITIIAVNLIIGLNARMLAQHRTECANHEFDDTWLWKRLTEHYRFAGGLNLDHINTICLWVYLVSRSIVYLALISPIFYYTQMTQALAILSIPVSIMSWVIVNHLSYQAAKATWLEIAFRNLGVLSNIILVVAFIVDPILFLIG